MAVLVAVAVVVTAALVPRLVDDDAGSGAAGEPAGEVDGDLSEVEVFEVEPSHDNGDLDYPESPPVGGVHNDIWLDCGVYDEPVPEQHVVHDLEHGTVWVTYHPDLDDDAVDDLADALPQNGILSPYDDLSAPVVVTVWGRQLQLTGADDPRLELFIEEYDEGVTAPEPFASCAGGATLEQLEQLDQSGGTNA